MNTISSSLFTHSINPLERIFSQGFLTEEEITFLTDNFEKIELRKNEILIEEGKNEPYIFFIEKGIVRHWTLIHKTQKEVSLWFSFTDEFINLYSSLIHYHTSPLNVQTLSKCSIWRIEKNKLFSLYSSSLSINKIARIFLENLLLRKVYREIFLLKLDAKERYNHLMEKEKKLLRTIPLKYLASYLGITPQTLSKIRKNNSQDNR